MKMRAAKRKSQSRAGSQHGNQQCFGHQLAQDALSSRANSNADGHFLAAARGASKKKARDVGACNQENESDGGEKNDEGGVGIEVVDYVLLESQAACVPAGFGVREQLNGERAESA